MEQSALKSKVSLLLTSITAGFIISGCSSIVEVKPAPISTAKFPIEQFKEVDEYTIENVKVIDTNGSKFVMLPMKDFTSFVEQYKKVKNTYSILRTNLIKFEKDKDELNRKNLQK